MFEASRLQWRKLLSFIHLPLAFFGLAEKKVTQMTPQIHHSTSWKWHHKNITKNHLPEQQDLHFAQLQPLPHLKKMKRLRFLPLTSTSGWLFNPLRATGSGGVQLESGGWLFKPGPFQLVLSPLKLSLIISYVYIFRYTYTYNMYNIYIYQIYHISLSCFLIHVAM